MSDQRQQFDELRELLIGLVDGREDQLDDETWSRRMESLLNDPVARKNYLQYIMTDAVLRLEHTAPPATSPLTFPSPLSTTHYPPPTTFVGGPVFSYMVATVILCLMLLGGWAYKISHDRDLHVVKNSRRSTTSGPSDRVFVGRITGTKDCRWSNENTQTVVGAAVPLDREYALASGLLEITYQSGAKVILEGPCTYKVESSAGGFLERGKMTANIRGQRSEVRGQISEHSPLSSLLSPLFSVKTPTAVITDLGTEFGVEVDESGACLTHVFSGSVKVQTGSGDGAADGTPRTEIVLGENESIRVAAGGPGRRAIVTRETVQPGHFICHMPRRMQIKLFNTGIGLKEGDPDPHWQLAAVSNDPDFKPRQAVVTRVYHPHTAWLANYSPQSQWISTANEPPDVANDVTYTFRTTFDLAGMLPGTAVLRGGFIADNRVNAIRLNGKPLSLPEHEDLPPFDRFHEFSANKGFVPGINVLEIDVYNGSSEQTDLSGPGAMLLRVELSGTFTYMPGASSAIAGDRSDNRNKESR